MAAMFCGVMLCRLFCMVTRKSMVSMRSVSVMARGLVGAGLMMLGRLEVMPGGMSVMFGCLLVMLCTFMLRHFIFPLRLASGETSSPQKFTIILEKTGVRVLAQNGFLVALA
jgi:hypothetical protein